MSGKTALVVIDVQHGLFLPPYKPHKEDAFLATLAELLRRARAAGTPVVYIQHDGGDDSPIHPAKTEGWPIHPAIAPKEHETVVRKRFCDAFQETALDEHLKGLGVTRLVLAGIQTEHCVDTTCRRAFSLGYQITLVEDGHTTYDTAALRAEDIIAHHNQIIGESFGAVEPAEKIQF
jgi:nicotinamidase-related amidase